MTDSPLQEDDMNIKRIATAGLMTAALVGVSVTSAFATMGTASASPQTSACPTTGPNGAWPVVADGVPARDPGVRVWHDGAGWHVRVTHDTLHDRVFTGEIVTTGTLIDVHAVRLEKNDYIKAGPDGHKLYFRFNNYGGVDGFDFATHCAPWLAFGFRTDGHLVPLSRISVGATAFHPKHDPFVIRRTA
jgi:hypothetical protein